MTSSTFFISNTDLYELDFLEYAINLKPEIISSKLYLTCMHLYLRSYAVIRSPNIRQSLSVKIMQLLDTPNAHYDVPQAMILCKMNGFDDGLLYLYQKSGHYQLILNYYIKKRDSAKVITTCQDHGMNQTSLWVDAFWFFVSESKEDAKNSTRLQLVLHEIEKNKLLSPLMVINILAKNNGTTIDVLKDYFMRFLTRESSMISENERVIHQHKDDTERMKRSIEEMKTQPKVFQANKCSASGCIKQLDLPSVHYFCDHSYHLSCLPSSEQQNMDTNECPICAPDNKNLLDLLKSRENNSNLHETFTEQLSKSDADVIAVISSFFSKGVFGRNF